MDHAAEDGLNPENFSAIANNHEIKPSHEATILYLFPLESFAGRPFGLNIALNYRGASGNQFSEAVFNETVSIIKVVEGLDGETFFLYVFLAAASPQPAVPRFVRQAQATSGCVQETGPTPRTSTS
ncbi:translocon-associated protein subunit alpha [Culex quinquefasciatus]|uniref:Translocon-associated protein subunit alpha n=1 Tax=Culex quinquefasciatus TaxID=7176 RepID=B0WJ09_CULQU|nr:translocon-associated protein subunit alpha [Culex quinquefasciatus]|eukprot:XP_001848693.1 translocon-associated protein subunit alpha [Culex quinquefasciatus]